MRKLTKWDLRFIQRAKDVSEYSKDKNTKTGAVIVNDDKTEIVMGYNWEDTGHPSHNKSYKVDCKCKEDEV